VDESARALNKTTALMKKKSCILRSAFTLAFIGLISLLSAQNRIFAGNNSELFSAISKAKAGDTVVLKNGEWKNVNIDFNSDAKPELPVTLLAQTPGKVTFSGNSTLVFSKPYLIVNGMVFKNGKLNDGSVVSFNSDHCRLTNSAIIDYNPDNFQTGYYWIYFKGSYNRIDHCLLRGKSNMNPVLGNDNENARYNKADSCYIKDIPYLPKTNGREIFRIWGYGHDDQTGDDGAYFSIEYNLFEHADGEGTEIVSLKSNHNVVKFNTVIASKGGLVGRRGKDNTFEGNIILGEGVKGTTGIRVAGADHKVINNYIADVSEDGLRLIAGEFYDKNLTGDFAKKKKSLPKYLQVENGYFANNLIADCGGNGIDIGYSYKNDWPELQMVLLPQNNQFVKNVIYNCRGYSVNIVKQDSLKPLNIFHFKPNTFSGNIVYGKSTCNTAMPVGINVQNPDLRTGKDGIYRFDFKNNTNLTPLKPENVGPEWIKKCK